MAEITKEKFKVGTDAMILFENINGVPFMEALAQDVIPMPMAIEIMACTWKGGDIDSYGEFKSLDEFQDLVFDAELRSEIFVKIMGDVQKKFEEMKAKHKK